MVSNRGQLSRRTIRRTAAKCQHKRCFRGVAVRSSSTRWNSICDRSANAGVLASLVGSGRLLHTRRPHSASRLPKSTTCHCWLHMERRNSLHSDAELMTWTCPTCGTATKAEPVYPVRCICGAVWENQTTQAGACIHLGERTGETIQCSTCSGGGVNVHLCTIHGATTLRKPVPRAGAKRWTGMDCTTCRATDQGYER